MNNVLFRRGDQTFIDENVPLNDGQIIFNETDEAIYVDTLINNIVTRKRYGGGNLSRSDIDMALSAVSENPVANKVLTELMLQKADVIDDLATAVAVTENGVPVGCGSIKTLNTTVEDIATRLNKMALLDNAGSHNCIYRGKFLGNAVTAKQWSAIRSGAFTDLYIGDYWTINSINWRIASFDYYYNCGDTNFTTHHIIVVPDQSLGTASMNDTHTTAGGYNGCKFRTTTKSTYTNQVKAVFGSSHVLSHRIIITNAINSNGQPSGWEWVDSDGVELMSERMVYGSSAWGNVILNTEGNGYNCGVEKSQLDLFKYRHDIITTRYRYWLRDIRSAAYFCLVSDGGHASRDDASIVYAVRPACVIG